MRLAALVAGLAFLAVHARTAHAISACGGDRGWAPASGVLPPHAHLVFRDNRSFGAVPKIVATLDGKPVAIKQTTLESKPWRFVLVEIDSNRAGKLEIGFEGGGTQSYTIAAKTKYAASAKATTSRYHHKLPHSTVREVFDGLEIKVDVPATLAHVKLRRDAKSAWSELDAPVVDGAIHIGELGCVQNFTPQLLENGMDIDVDLTLPDGAKAHVKDLTHVVLPKLAKPTSDNPGDAE